MGGGRVDVALYLTKIFMAGIFVRRAATRQLHDDGVEHMASLTPPILDIAARVAAERAVARGGIWGAVTAYVEAISLLVQWESELQPGWLPHTVVGLAVVAAHVVQLRRPGRLALHAARAGVFLAMSALFCVNMVVWNGGLLGDSAEGVLVVLLPWPLLLTQALFAARHARASPIRFVDIPFPVSASPAEVRRWSRLKDRLEGPRAMRAAPWIVVALVVAGAGITLALLQMSNVVDSPLARLPQLWLAAAALIGYRGLRHLQPRAAEVRAADARSPVLILRAFDDDRLKMQRLALGPRTTFEQLISNTMRGRGPVITVGDPNEPLPRLGAAREYLQDADWRRAVDALIGEAAQLVFILADSENLAWELRRTVALQRLPDALVLVPPVNQRDADRRWNGLMTRDLGLPDRAALSGVPPPGLVAVVFPGGQPVLLVSKHRRRGDYAFAIGLAAALQAAGEGGAGPAIARIVHATALVRECGPARPAPASNPGSRP